MKHSIEYILKVLPAAALLFPSLSECAPVTVIRNVRLVPMDRERIVDGRAILVKDGRIAGVVGEDSLIVPPGAEVIDGRGGYLIPGLADMHTHLATYDPDPGHLAIYLAYGVTTVRSMSGVPENLSWRGMVARGEIPGPTIYSTGPVLTGTYGRNGAVAKYLVFFHAAVFLLPVVAGLALLTCVILYRRIRRGVPVLRGGHVAAFLVLLPVLTAAGWLLMNSGVIPFMSAGRFIIVPDYYICGNPSEAAREVARQESDGYDCLKVYDYITLEEYEAALAEASEIGFYVTGHLPDQIPLETIAKCGQNEMAHIDELQSYHWIGYEYGAAAVDTAAGGRYEFDYESIPRTVALVKESGMGAVSTLVVKEAMYRLIENVDGVLSGPEYRLTRREMLEYWRTRGKCVTSLRNYGEYRRNGMQPFLMELTRRIFRSGVVVATGSDTSNEGIVPGYHLHREMELLVEAGLTTFEALEAGTKNAGILVSRMGRDGDFGVIAEGMRADLVLLENNPLENISNTRGIRGVMTRGEWYTDARLREMLSSSLESY